MSLFGGLGIQSLNTLTPAALGAQQRAIDALLAVNEAGLSRMHDSQERKKDRDAQAKAQKKARQDSWMKMGVGAGVGAIAGGVGGLAMAPAALGAGVAGAGTAATTAGTTAASAAPMIAGTTDALTAGTVADAALAAPSLSSAQGIIGAGSNVMAGGIPTAATGGANLGVGAGMGFGTGFLPNTTQPNMPQYSGPGAYGGLVPGMGQSPMANMSAGGRFGLGMLGGFANAVAPGSGNAIFGAMNPLNLAHQGLYNAEAIAALARGDNSHAQSEHTRELTRFVGPIANAQIGNYNAQAYQHTQTGDAQGALGGLYGARTNTENDLRQGRIDKLGSEISLNSSRAGAEDSRAGYFDARSDDLSNTLDSRNYMNMGRGEQGFSAAGLSDARAADVGSMNPFKQDLLQAQTGAALSLGGLRDARTINAYATPPKQPSAPPQLTGEKRYLNHLNYAQSQGASPDDLSGILDQAYISGDMPKGLMDSGYLQAERGRLGLTGIPPQYAADGSRNEAWYKYRRSRGMNP